MLPSIVRPVTFAKQVWIPDAGAAVIRPPLLVKLILFNFLQTVGHFCKSHGLMFRSPPRGLYLGLQDRGMQFCSHVPVMLLSSLSVVTSMYCHV